MTVSPLRARSSDGIAIRAASRTVSFLAPVALAALPKCPLCLMPLLAALGIAAPPSSVLTGLVVLIVGAWVLMLARARRNAARWLVLAAAAVTLAGRLTGIMFAATSGVTLMMVVSVLALRTSDTCHSRCSAAPTLNRSETRS